MQLQIELFSRDFGGYQPVCGIGHLILREMPFSLRHIVGKRGFEFFKAVTRCRADIIDLLKRAFVGQFRCEREQLILGCYIDLVQN